jgi:predicted RNA-binding Zn ribbon-like protein
MPANVRADRDEPLPVRGVPGGWRDWWDDPDDTAELSARAEVLERRHLARAAVLGRRWQREIREEQRQHERERSRRGSRR